MISKFKGDLPGTIDKLIIMSDNGTADIATVYETDHEKIKADSATAEYITPLADVKAFASSRGMIYVYPATQENIEDCKRLAELEKSIVLRQITQYEKPLPPADERMNFMKVFPYILIILLVIIVAVK